MGQSFVIGGIDLLASSLGGLAMKSLGKPYTINPAANASYPDAVTGRSFVGGSWGGSKLTDANYGGGYTSGEDVGWDSGADPAVRIDLGSAQSVSQVVARGRYGTGGVYRPQSFIVEHSDDDSTYTQDYSSGVTSDASQPGDGPWTAVLTFTGSSHRYWRVTLGRRSGGFLFANEIELWG